MKFLDLIKMLKERQENQNALVVVKCGAFFVAIGYDAMWLSKNLKLKTTCITNRTCVQRGRRKLHKIINEIETRFDKININNMI